MATASSPRYSTTGRHHSHGSSRPVIPEGGPPRYDMRPFRPAYSPNPEASPAALARSPPPRSHRTYMQPALQQAPPHPENFSGMGRQAEEPGFYIDARLRNIDARLHNMEASVAERVFMQSQSSSTPPPDRFAARHGSAPQASDGVVRYLLEVTEDLRRRVEAIEERPRDNVPIQIVVHQSPSGSTSGSDQPSTPPAVPILPPTPVISERSAQEIYTYSSEEPFAPIRRVSAEEFDSGTRLVPFMDITEAGLAALLYPFFSSDIPLAAEAVSETNIQPVVAPSTYGGTEAGDQHEQPEWPETLSLSFQHSSPKKQMAVAPRLDEPLSPDSQNSQPSSVHSPQTPESPLTPPPWTPYSAPAPLLQIPGPTLAHQQAPQQVPMVVDSPDIGGALPALPQDVSQPFALVHHLFGVIGSLESRVAVLEGQVSGVRPRGHTVSGISMVPPSQPEGSLPESVSYAGYAASPSMLTREHSYVVPLSMASPMLVPFPSSSSYSSASPIAIPETDAQGAQGSRKPSIAVSAPMEPSGERSAGAPVTIQNQATTHPDTGSSLWSRVTRWWQAQP
ncbi:uncharacterized protein PHACADRAFT_200393 [Phanerochaete carnosa HHB-10118-sp]|uniref:Uncharacterized protein n=1 Tax=Phanerochaete carnosa (strain HHB-10118-sp) TaxID=650164 RepID=K5VV53_PHACS|nr:uncharacterized protein PHACADRAFT_200393 [Phanerochaete carnosa HHB-10118-sp]EKM50449.1 hypothetical protein PHACADRAFT_200393 [Phanerochaete carnosa HHB-10118-sp]